MNKETLNTLREAVLLTEESLELIEQENDLEQKDKYLQILERALTDLKFIKSHYDLSLTIEQQGKQNGAVSDTSND